ncbi:MAG TPA: TfoX/Sxy family protein [Mucilaginibacter sp.]
MAKIYDFNLADRIREALAHLPDVEEKEMFSGVVFMVDGKMCVGVSHNDLMCRVGADIIETLLDENGVRQMMMRDKPAKDFIYVSPEAFQNQKDFNRWIKLSLDFNPKAKASKKKK